MSDKKGYMARIDKEMKEMIEQTKKEFSQGWRIDPSRITTPAITPQIVHWAKIGKELDRKKTKSRKLKDPAAEFMDSITGIE